MQNNFLLKSVPIHVREKYSQKTRSRGKFSDLIKGVKQTTLNIIVNIERFALHT